MRVIHNYLYYIQLDSRRDVVNWIGGRRRSRYSRHHRQNFTVIRYDHLAGYCHRTAELLLYLEEQLQDTTRGLRTPSVIGGVVSSQYLEIPGL